jgi:hypothetical protein
VPTLSRGIMLVRAHVAHVISCEMIAIAVASFVSRLERDYQLLSFADIVLNHTADNTDWLSDHPEVRACVCACERMTKHVCRQRTPPTTHRIWRLRSHSTRRCARSLTSSPRKDVRVSTRWPLSTR